MGLRLKAIVIGYGYWGPNLARNIAESAQFELAGVVDQSEKSRELAKNRFPGIRIFSSLKELNPTVCDVVFIATPAVTHFSIAKEMLEIGMHVWVEKPATVEFQQTLQLIALAEKLGKRIFVDHPYVYSPAVVEMKSLVSQGAIGKPLYFNSQRANLGIFQPDVSVLYDLAVHDLSIFNFCLPNEIEDWVSCSLANPLNSGTDSIANLNISYQSGLMLNVSCNWLSPIKVRSTLIIGTDAAVIFDDNASVEKLKIYAQKFTPSHTSRKNLDFTEMLISYRTGDVVSPQLSPIEPLRLAINDLGDCLMTNETSRNELFNQKNVMALLEMAQLSASSMGARMNRPGSD
jgi:predicted dehydrogenase